MLVRGGLGAPEGYRPQDAEGSFGAVDPAHPAAHHIHLTQHEQSSSSTSSNSNSNSNKVTAT
jgi:hypothetical protein